MLCSSREDDTERNIFNFLFVRIKRFTTNFLSLIYKKTSPSVNVIFLGNHPTVKNLKARIQNLMGKMGLGSPNHMTQRNCWLFITAILVFLTDRCQGGEITQNKW
jgi:hypothetical protein